MNSCAKSFIVVCIAILVVIDAKGIEAHEITTEQVSGLLHLDGSDALITIPQVASRTLQPRLAVQEKTVTRTVVRVRIGCIPARDCLPFYGFVSFATVSGAQKFARSIPATSGSRQSKRKEIVVRAGTLVRLDVIEGRVTLRVPVRSLQSGATGEIVSARDEQTRRIYRALVVDRNLLRSVR